MRTKTILLLAVYAYLCTGLFSCSGNDTLPKAFDVTHVNLNTLQDIDRTIDQLQYYGYINVLGKDMVYAWNKQSDVIFNAPLDSLTHNAVFESLVTCLQYASTRKAKENKSAVEEGRFADLLPADFENDYLTQISLLSRDSYEKNVGSIQFSLIYILSFMQPVLEDLLKEDNLDEEKIIDAYVEARKKDMLYQILLPLFKQLNPEDEALKIMIRSGADRKKVYDLIDKTEATGSFTFPLFTRTTADSLRYIQSYYSHLQDFFAAKKELTAFFYKVVGNMNEFNEKYIQVHHLDRFKISNAFEDIVNRKQFELSPVSANDSEYVDIEPQSSGNAFFIRLRFKQGAFHRLDIDGEINRTQAEAYLVYKLNDGEENTFNQPDSFSALSGKVGKTVTEISTGLTIQELTIKKVKPGKRNTSGITFHYPETDIYLDMSLPEVGIWSRYKYNAAKLKDINDVLMLSKSLGIELTEIRFDSASWEPKLLFSWQPMGLFKKIQYSVNGFTDIQVRLSEVVPGPSENFREALNRLLVKKVCEKISSCSKADNSKVLTSLLHSEHINSIKAYPISPDNDIITGQISLSNVAVPYLNIATQNITLDFRIGYADGKPTFGFENLNLNPFTEQFLSLIKSESPKIKIDKNAGIAEDAGEKIRSVISQHLPVTSLSYDFITQSPVVIFKDKVYKIRNKDELIQFANTAVSTYLKTPALKKELLKAAESTGQKILAAADVSLLKIPKCDDLLNHDVTFFGITFKITDLKDCGVGYAKFTATFKSIVVKGIFDKGKFELVDIDKDKLFQELSEIITTQINFGKFIHIGRMQWDNNEIVLPLYFTIESFGFDEIVTEVRVASNGSIRVSRDEIFNSMSKLLTSFLKRNGNSLPLGEYAGLTVEFDSLNLLKREIVLKAQAKFDAGAITVHCRLRINFETGAIHCDILENAVSNIISFLSDGIFKGLLGGKSPVKIDDITPDNIRRMQISGTVHISVFGKIPLPDLRFTISPGGIAYNVRPKFTIPTAVPIYPPIVSFINPSVELMIDNKSVHFSGDFAPGYTYADIVKFSMLIKVSASMDIYYSERFGDIDFNGGLVILTLFRLTNGEGHISIPRRYVSIENNTTGPLKKYIDFSSKTELSADKEMFSAKTRGSLDLLSVAGLSLHIAASVNWHNKFEIHIDGYGGVAIPVGTLSGVIGTTLTAGGTEAMINLNAYAELSGRITLGKITLAGISAKANVHQAIVDFNVGPLHLAACLPTLSAFTSDYVFRMIMSIFASVKNLPSAILNFLRHPHITLFAPFGSGDGNIVYYGDEQNHDGKSQNLELYNGGKQSDKPSAKDNSALPPGGTGQNPPSNGQPGINQPAAGNQGTTTETNGIGNGQSSTTGNQPVNTDNGSQGNNNNPGTAGEESQPVNQDNAANSWGTSGIEQTPGNTSGSTKDRSDNNKQNADNGSDNRDITPGVPENNKPLKKLVLIRLPEMKEVDASAFAAKKRLKSLGINTEHEPFGKQAGTGSFPDETDQETAELQTSGAPGGETENTSPNGSQGQAKVVDTKPETENIMPTATFNCNCGNSKVGYQIATYEQVMNNLDKAFIATRNDREMIVVMPLKEQIETLRQCMGYNVNNLLFLVYTNNDDQPDYVTSFPDYPFDQTTVSMRRAAKVTWPRSLHKGEFVIYGYSSASASFKNFDEFDFFPILPSNSFEVNKLDVDLKKSASVGEGTEFQSLNNLGISFLSPDGTMPYLNYILAYNNNEVYLLATTFTRQQNNYSTPTCKMATLSYSDLYATGDTFSYPQSAGVTYKIRYCFYKKSRKELVEEKGAVDASEIFNKSKIRDFAKDMDEDSRLWLLVNSDGNSSTEIYPKNHSIITNQKVSNAGSNAFGDYVSLTGKLETRLDKQIILSILTSCDKGNNTSENLKTQLDKLRDSELDMSQMIKLNKYLNKVINNEPIDVADYCNDIYLKPIDVHVTPVVNKSGNKWESIFYTKKDRIQQQSILLDDNDLTNFFGLTAKSDIVQADFTDNKLLTNFFEYIWSTDIYQTNLNLVAYSPDTITWVKEDETIGQFSLATLDKMDYQLHRRTPQVYFLNDKLADVFSNGDFYNKADLDEKIPVLAIIMPALIRDTSEKIVIDYLYPDKVKSPLVIYKESATEIGLWVENQSRWMTISRAKFFNNIRIAGSSNNYKHIRTGRPRISVQLTDGDVMLRSKFIINGLRGIENWHSSPDTEINPLSLFNDQLQNIR